jgi:hypothetical protein
MKLPLLLFIALGVAILAPAWGDPIQATIITNTTGVEYKLPGKPEFEKLAWKLEMKLPSGTQIRTLKDGIAKFELFPGSKLFLMPDSTLTLSSMQVATAGDTITQRQASVKLANGTLKSIFNRKLGNNSPIDFQVHTPTGVAAARGTIYITSVIGGVTYVEVLQGTVTAGNLTLTPDTGIGVLYPDGSSKIIPLNQLPSNVQAALQNASQVTSTTEITTLPFNTEQDFNPRSTSGK